jgi:hypothetical protein
VRPRFHFAVLIAVLTPPVALSNTSDDTSKAARALVERAIEAQGGTDQVAKLFKPWRANVKGMAGPLQITGTLSHAGPDQGRIHTKLRANGNSFEVIVVNDGKHVWRKIGEQTQEVTGAELEEMQDGTWRSRKVRFLLPLLTEKGVDLSVLGEAVVTDRPAVGVRVKLKGHRDVDVYFDKENDRLVKMESRIKAPDNREIVLEQVFSDYKDFDGLKLATTFTKYENGRQTSVEQFTDLEFVDRIDPKEFAKPESPPR